MECYGALLSSFYCVGGYSIRYSVLYQGNLTCLMWVSVNYHTGRPAASQPDPVAGAGCCNPGGRVG